MEVKLTENKWTAFWEFISVRLRNRGQLMRLTVYLYLNMIAIKANSLWGRISTCIRIKINQNMHLKEDLTLSKIMALPAAVWCIYQHVTT